MRYRYDSEKKEKTKAVEIIVEKKSWGGNTQKIPRNKIMRIRVSYAETKLRSLVKAADGKWNREEKMGELPYGEVLALGLENRIAPD